MPETSWSSLMEEAGGSFEALPEGDYDAEVIACEYKTTSKGKEMWVATLRILTGPHAGRQVWNNFVLTPGNPNALRFFFQHMNVLGLGQEFFMANPHPTQVSDSLVGRRARIKVVQRSYQGRITNNVSAFMSVGGIPTAPPTPATPAPPMPAAPPQQMPQAPPVPAPQPPPPPPAPPAPPQPPAPPAPPQVPAPPVQQEQVLPPAPPTQQEAVPPPQQVAPPPPPAPVAQTEGAEVPLPPF